MQVPSSHGNSGGSQGFGVVAAGVVVAEIQPSSSLPSSHSFVPLHLDSGRSHANAVVVLGVVTVTGVVVTIIVVVAGTVVVVPSGS